MELFHHFRYRNSAKALRYGVKNRTWSTGHQLKIDRSELGLIATSRPYVGTELPASKVGVAWGVSYVDALPLLGRQRVETLTDEAKRAPAGDLSTATRSLDAALDRTGIECSETANPGLDARQLREKVSKVGRARVVGRGRRGELDDVSNGLRRQRVSLVATRIISDRSIR